MTVGHYFKLKVKYHQTIINVAVIVQYTFSDLDSFGETTSRSKGSYQSLNYTVKNVKIGAPELLL